jgi:hypothetical protein
MPIPLRGILAIMGLYALHKSLVPAIVDRLDRLSVIVLMGNPLTWRSGLEETQAIAESHPSPDVRMRACRMLSLALCRSSARSLMSIAGSDPEVAVRHACLRYILAACDYPSLTLRLGRQDANAVYDLIAREAALLSVVQEATPHIAQLAGEVADLFNRTPNR